MFDNISQGFVLADYSGQTEGGEHDLRILNVNPAIEKHFGLKPDDITAKSVDISWNKDKTITAYAADVAGGSNRYHLDLRMVILPLILMIYSLMKFVEILSIDIQFVMI